MSVLALSSVTKSFGGVEALVGLDLEVAPARITGLIGPNGAGKTTVVNLITGMIRVTAGSIRFGDRDITHAAPSDIARSGIARTFQNIRLLNEASVLENVMIGFHRHERTSLLASLLALPSARRERRELQERALELLERFDLATVCGRAAGSLSYGHQRRLEVVRALAMGPDLILFDEPVAGMNDVEADELGGFFRQIAATRVGLLLIEHNMRFVTSICDVVHVLNTGRIIASGTPDAVCANPEVISAYLGE